MTLLENLLLVDHAKGGTIHQYIDNYGNEKSLAFEDALTRDYLKFGSPVSYGTINHYAEKRGVWIKWSDATRAFYEPTMRDIHGGI